MSNESSDDKFFLKNDKVANEILYNNRIHYRKKNSQNFETKNNFFYKENIEDLLIETLQNFIGKTDKDMDYIGPVEQKSLFNYLIIVFIATVFFYGFLFILTFVQLIIPLFSFNVSLTLVLIFFFVSQFIFYILEFIVLNIRILSSITLIILLALYGSIIFLIANNLNTFSIIITNISILIFYALIILIIFIVGVQLEQLKRFSPKFDVSTFLYITLLSYICFEFINQNRGFLFWLYLPICFCIYFQYSSEVVELWRGVSGPYKGLNVLEGIMTLTTMIYGQYVMIMIVFYIVKGYGFIIFFPVPPWYYVLPAEWFTWL